MTIKPLRVRLGKSLPFPCHLMNLSDHLPNEKYCSKCDAWKSRGDFNKCKAAKDGLHGYCRVCDRASAKDRSKARREAARKSGSCRYCGKPRLDDGLKSPQCLDCKIRTLYQITHNRPNKNRVIPWKILKPYLPIVIQLWYDQGGDEFGNGAICKSTGKIISLIDPVNPADLGHIQPIQHFRLLDGTLDPAFGYPNNLMWQCRQDNQEKQSTDGSEKDWSDKRVRLGKANSLIKDAYRHHKSTHPHLARPPIKGAKLRDILGHHLPFPCPYFPHITLDWASLSLDHIVPVSEGGDHSLSNLQIISRVANYGKKNHSHYRYCKILGIPYFEPTSIQDLLDQLPPT